MIEYLSIMLNARRAKLDERGASAVEYGLLIAGIAAVIVIIVIALGGQITSAFDKTCDNIANANASGSSCATTTP